MGNHARSHLYEAGDLVGETLAVLDKLDMPDLLAVLLAVARQAETEELLSPAELAWLRLVLDRALRQPVDRAA